MYNVWLFLQLAIKSSPEKFHNKKKQHTIQCVLHGVESSVGIFYPTIEVHICSYSYLGTCMFSAGFFISS